MTNNQMTNNEITNNQMTNNQIDYNDFDNNQNQTNNKEFQKNIKEQNNQEKNTTDEWNFDGIQIFNSVKSSKLDMLNEMSKLKRKEKKVTRKRVKNVESLIQDKNYNIFDFIHSSANIKIDDIGNKIKKDKTNGYDVQDRAILYEDYKTTLEGYTFKKKNSKPCTNCNIDKVLIYSEGIYVCMGCGEVENYVVESEINNYKDPMVEKPTFPYKRKNHFCEWIKLLLLVKVICKTNSYLLC